MKALFFLCAFYSLGFSESSDGGTCTSEKVESEGITYNVFLPDNIPSFLKGLFLDKSILIKLAQKPPGSLTALNYRITNDIRIFKEVLDTFGYYKSEILYEIRENKDPLYGEPEVSIILKANLKERYKLKKITLETKSFYLKKRKKDPRFVHQVTNLKGGDFVNYDDFKAGAKRLFKYLREQGYAFARVEDAEAVINHNKSIVNVYYKVKTGPLCTIQGTEISGLKGLSKDYILNRVRWKKGDIYDQKNVKKTSKKLIKKPIIGNFTIEPIKAGKPSKNKAGETVVPVKMQVKAQEAPPKAIGLSAQYSTSEGLGGGAFWKHYNFLGNGERLGLNLSHAKKTQTIKLDYTAYDLFSAEQKLINELGREKSETDAYKGRTFFIGSKFTHPVIRDYLSLSVGVKVEAENYTQKGADYKYKLVGIPLDIELDASDSKLNPTSGFRAYAGYTQYFGKIKSIKNFSSARVGGSLYLPFMKKITGHVPLVVALFGRSEKIFVKNSDDLSPKKRLYSGGSGSIRGYKYQLLGPLDADGDPVGGRFRLEMGAEVRYNLAEQFGLAAFYETGLVSKKRLPKLALGNFLGAYGVGARLYTPVGPIRLDIAFPTKRRKQMIKGKLKRVDPAFQFYISVGQAF